MDRTPSCSTLSSLVVEQQQMVGCLEGVPILGQPAAVPQYPGAHGRTGVPAHDSWCLFRFDIPKATPVLFFVCNKNNPHTSKIYIDRPFFFLHVVNDDKTVMLLRFLTARVRRRLHRLTSYDTQIARPIQRHDQKQPFQKHNSKNNKKGARIYTAPLRTCMSRNRASSASTDCTPPRP